MSPGNGRPGTRGPRTGDGGPRTTGPWPLAAPTTTRGFPDDDAEPRMAVTNGGVEYRMEDVRVENRRYRPYPGPQRVLNEVRRLCTEAVSEEVWMGPRPGNRTKLVGMEFMLGPIPRGEDSYVEKLSFKVTRVTERSVLVLLNEVQLYPGCHGFVRQPDCPMSWIPSDRRALIEEATVQTSYRMEGRDLYRDYIFDGGNPGTLYLYGDTRRVLTEGCILFSEVYLPLSDPEREGEWFPVLSKKYQETWRQLSTAAALKEAWKAHKEGGAGQGQQRRQSVQTGQKDVFGNRREKRLRRGGAAGEVTVRGGAAADSPKRRFLAEGIHSVRDRRNDCVRCIKAKLDELDSKLAKLDPAPSSKQLRAEFLAAQKVLDQDISNLKAACKKYQETWKAALKESRKAQKEGGAGQGQQRRQSVQTVQKDVLGNLREKLGQPMERVEQGLKGLRLVKEKVQAALEAWSLVVSRVAPADTAAAGRRSRAQQQVGEQHQGDGAPGTPGGADVCREPLPGPVSSGMPMRNTLPRESVSDAAAGADAEADAEAGAGRGQKRSQSEQPLQNDVFGNRREKGRREEITTRTMDHKRLLDHSADSEDTQYAGHPVPGFGSAPSPW